MNSMANTASGEFMKNIAIVIGTRPEAIKMAPVYLELKLRFGKNVQLILTWPA